MVILLLVSLLLSIKKPIFFFFFFEIFGGFLKTAIIGWYTLRISHPEVFLRKGVLEIYRKFTREHPYRNVTSIKLLCNLLCIFIEITLRDDGCSQVNLQHISRTPFSKITSGWLLLYTTSCDSGIPWICNFLSYQLPCEFSVMWWWRLPS